MSKVILQTNKLTKQYGNVKAANQISVQVEQGAIYGLIGKNGAGKTTFMKMITGIINPSSGEITFNEETDKKAQKNLRRIGALIESPGIYGDMTAFENLKMKAIGMGIYDKQKIEEIIDLIGLNNAGKKKAKNFSLGMKQRLGIGLALVGNPDLLVLDEPINGLDPQGIVEVRKLIEKLNKERNMTVIISSHILDELYKLVTHIGIIDHGNLLVEMSKEELDKKCEKKIILNTGNIKEATIVLEKYGFNEYTVFDANTIHIHNRIDEVEYLVKLLVQNDIPVSGIVCQKGSLEEFFIDVLNKGAK